MFLRIANGCLAQRVHTCTAKRLKDKHIQDIEAGFKKWQSFRSSTSACAGVFLTGIITKFFPTNSPLSPCFEIRRDSDPLTATPGDVYLLRSGYRDNFLCEFADLQVGVRVEFTPTGPFPRNNPPPASSNRNSPGKRRRFNNGPNSNDNHPHWSLHCAEAVKPLKISKP